MRNRLLTIAACMTCGTLVFAADNSKEIEALLRGHSEATIRAEQTKLREIARSKDLTITQLVKAASKAYASKDRVAETSAWRAVIQLDRSHEKANQYFRDLGTLDKVKEELKEGDAGAGPNQLKFAGKWNLHYANNSRNTLQISVVGRPDVQELPKGPEYRTVWSNDSLVTQAGDTLKRLTMAGDRMLVEEWWPSSKYQTSAPTSFGYGVRAE